VRAKFRLPVTVMLLLGGIAGVGSCRQAVQMAADDAGGPSVPLSVLRAFLWFAAAAVAGLALAQARGEAVPTLGAEARAAIATGLRAHPLTTLTTSRGAQALALAWGLFVVINVGLFAEALAQRSRAQANPASPSPAVELAALYVGLQLIPVALVWVGSFTAERRSAARSAILAVAQTLVMAAVVFFVGFSILVLSTGRGVSD
jgi:hypothetical protein